VFGANDNNLIPLMLSAPRNIHFGPGTNLYDFTYGPNLADAHILAAVNLLTVSPADKSNLLSAAGKAFFVTNAEPMPFRDFLSQLWTTFDGKKPPKGVSIPTAVALPLVWLMEHVSKAVGKTPALTTKDLGDSLAERWFDNSRAAEVFGYVPKVKIADGLKEAAKDYEELKNGYEISLRDASRPISNT
jgi:sterol-4alpha-carboxylate 3-dehydrogenase (decarboxylating)